MGRRAFPLPAVLAFALALAAAPAPADPFTNHFEDLLVVLNDRDEDVPFTGGTAEERRQRSALNRCFKALSFESPDLRGDLKTARKMAGFVEKGFPGDGEFQGLLVGLNDGLAGAVDGERDDTVVLISIAQAGRLRDRAEARLAAADAMFIAADAEETQSRRARGRERGFRAVLQASALAVKAGTGGSGDASTMSAVVDGQAWASNTNFGTGITGLADVSTASGALRKVVFSGRRILPSSTSPPPPKPPLPGETSRIQITLTSANENIVAGVYTTGNSNGVNASASWYHEDEDENVSQAVSTAGTVEITSLVIKQGSIDISGTFTLTMYDGLADAVFSISSGTFEVVGLPRNSIP